jgi:thiol-disulfide isomerase/thioredoxin
VTRRRMVAALAAVLLLLSGCAAATPAAPAKAAGDLLRFTGKTLDGAAFDAATLAGRPVVLWFWAPWCATCAGEAFSITNLAGEYGSRLTILGVAGMGDNKAMHDFVSDLEVTGVTSLDDQQGVIWKKFGITEQSTYVFLDRTGAVAGQGYLDDQQLTAKVKSLVA